MSDTAHAPCGPKGVNMAAARLSRHILSRLYTVLLCQILRMLHVDRQGGGNMAAARLGRHILSRVYSIVHYCIVLCQILRSAHAPRGPAGVNMVAARL